jgi:hypothetical protein
MTTEQLLEKLTDAAGRMGLDVRTEKGNFEGGRCRMAGAEVVMLNERDLPERRLAVLARALRAEELEAVYLPPAVRHALDEARAGEGAPGGADEQQRAPEPSASDVPGEEVPAHAE